MATNYTFYLMAYGQGGEARAVVDQYNISTPSSHGQLAAHALGLSDWRDGSPPRACAEVDAKLTELLRPRPGVNVGGVKMGEMTEVLRNIASEADRVAGGSGVPGEVSAANTSRPWCGGRVEEGIPAVQWRSEEHAKAKLLAYEAMKRWAGERDAITRFWDHEYKEWVLSKFGL